MITHKLSATLFCALGASALAPSADAFLLTYYNPANGEVLLETPELGIGAAGFDSYRLEINQPLFDLDNWIELIPSSFIPDSNETTIKFETNFLTSPLVGLYTIGEILPAGLTPAEVDALWVPFTGSATTGSYASRGAGAGRTGNQAVSFVYGDAAGTPVNEELAPTAEAADFIYNTITGDVTIKTDDPELGGTINGIFLQSTGDFLPDNFVNPFFSPLTGSSVVNDSVVAAVGDPLDPGEYDLGNFLAPGLTIETIQNELFDARFFGDGGVPIFNTRGTEEGMAFNIIVIPEPATGLLAALGGLLVASRRRR